MELKTKINADYLVAFKSKNVIAKNVLSVVKGEIQTIEKNTGSSNLSDEEVIKILNKTAKSLKETISLSGDQKSIQELEIVESYLPTQMSDEEITRKISEVISTGATNIGMIMKEFSTLPADKKKVSEIAKNLLSL
jgi:uncharacterized protein YqeY